MAGRFKGNVGKLQKPKIKNKRKKGRKVMSLVKRGKKLDAQQLQGRIAELMGSSETPTAETSKSEVSSAATDASRGSSFLGNVKIGQTANMIHVQTVPSTKKGKSIEVLRHDGKKEKVLATNDAHMVERTTTEAQGLKMLHRAIKNQSHQQLLPFQARHDYEYRLRRVATMGAVKLFNSLAQAQKVGDTTLEEAQKKVTLDKAQGRKLVASREAFLAALSSPSGADANSW